MGSKDDGSACRDSVLERRIPSSVPGTGTRCRSIAAVSVLRSMQPKKVKWSAAIQWQSAEISSVTALPLADSSASAVSSNRSRIFFQSLPTRSTSWMTSKISVRNCCKTASSVCRSIRNCMKDSATLRSSDSPLRSTFCNPPSLSRTVRITGWMVR